MKKFFLVLFIIFLSGILSADICLEQIKESTSLLDKVVYQGYANAKLNFQDVFWSVLYERIKLFSVFILFCLTPIREKLSVILVALFSFIWGFFSMCCVAEMGLAGVVIAIFSVIPHGLLYGAVVLMLLQNRRLRTYHTKDRAVKGVASYVFMILMFLTGCVLESIVGTHFIPWVIRLSMV